ncbi:LiaF transmembrane domain-containing protein [Haloarchaeobius salinus]|uniref:LiaF transmembrane domain-containing protein n=1 Tax=Haloarchaeobius salinus TaxID=1198298 RepID=UPI00210AEB79|nr:LiaF domain-containing protein [Haloarchaeobius salinus]
MSTTSSRRIPSVQVLFGALVVVLGALLLLDTTGVFPTTDLLLYAPSLFVVVGLWALFQSRLRNIVGPVVLVTIGAAWQAVALDFATVDDVIVFWPVLVIAFGLSVVLGTYRAKTVAIDDAYTSMFAAFGGVERRNTSKAFTGADLTALFGGAEIDLRDAEVTDRPARINAVALFGAAEVIVPRDWNVQMDVLPVLGAAEDSRRRYETINDEVDLVVGGFTAFGGIEVKD